MAFSAEEILASSTHILALPLGRMLETPILMGGGGGLPEGALYLTGAKLVLCSTVCDAPMFKDRIIKACAHMRRDIVLQRVGLFPETLNPVSADVVLHSMGGPFYLEELSYMRALDGSLWLIPARGASYIEIRPEGLFFTTEPPFVDRDDRSDGLCRAAAEIVRHLRGKAR